MDFALQMQGMQNINVLLQMQNHQMLQSQLVHQTQQGFMPPPAINQPIDHQPPVATAVAAAAPPQVMQSLLHQFQEYSKSLNSNTL